MSDSESAPTQFVCAIANPLADKKTSKKLLKVVTKAAEAKVLRRGVKEVVKALRKKTIKGESVVILAADVSPVDVITHIPVFAEENGVPYVFVPSKAALGGAAKTKRPTSVVLVDIDSLKSGKATELLAEVKGMAPVFK